MPQIDFEYKNVKNCESLKIQLPKDLYIDVVNKIVFNISSSTTCEINDVLNLGSLKLTSQSHNQSVFMLDKKLYKINSIDIAF